MRRRESLGYSFKTENLQARSFRKALVDKRNRPFKGNSYYLTAIVPILKETYRVYFNGTKKPSYSCVGKELVRDAHVMGILTTSPIGEIPPVTLCEQYNDLRADQEANTVFTYAFVNMDPSSMRAQISDPNELISVIKN